MILIERTYENAHSGSQIWSVAALKESEIITGGGDGSLRTWLCNQMCPQQLCLPAEVTDNHPKIVKFINDKIIILTNLGGLFLCNTDGKLKISITLDILKNYAVMDADDRIVVCGSLDGAVIVLHAESLQILHETQCTEGKIFALSLLECDQILVNGVNGILILMNLTSSSVTEVVRSQLPDCKQRWFSASSNWRDKIVVGDRMGGVHVFDKAHLHLIKSFHKLHGRNGVTDIKNSK